MRVAGRIDAALLERKRINKFGGGSGARQAARRVWSGVAWRSAWSEAEFLAKGTDHQYPVPVTSTRRVTSPRINRAKTKKSVDHSTDPRSGRSEEEGDNSS